MGEPLGLLFFDTLMLVGGWLSSGDGIVCGSVGGGCSIDNDCLIYFSVPRYTVHERDLHCRSNLFSATENQYLSPSQVYKVCSLYSTSLQA